MGSEQKTLNAASGAKEELTAQTEQPVNAEEEEEEEDDVDDEEAEVVAKFELSVVKFVRE